jgi:hypothetical protein
MAGNNTMSIISPYLQGGNPDTLNQAPPPQMAGGGYPPGSFFPYAPGDLGEPFELSDRVYSVVFNDSGATSATPTGQVAANQLAFWKDKSARIVTNDRRFAIVPGNQSANYVAGIYRVAAGPGNLICILTKGYNIPVKSGVAAVPGELLVADVAANFAQVLGMGALTAATSQVVGTSRAAAGGGNVTSDVNIPNL